MRCDQFMGLNEWATEFLVGKRILIGTMVSTLQLIDGTSEPQEPQKIYRFSVTVVEIDAYTGMFGDRYPLFKHTFDDGRVFKEKLQRAPWSSGPVHFLCLIDAEGKDVPESLWTEKEIQEAT